MPNCGNPFGSNAPYHYLPFPALSKITIAEIVAFRMNDFRNDNVIDRLVCAGMTAGTATKMANHFRTFPRGKSIISNTIYVIWRNTMRENNWGAGWTVASHEIEGYDTTILDVETIAFHPPKATPGVPFKDLTKDVKVMPSGSEALDLTRCVAHAAAHPDEVWVYPDDYARLLTHIGGPMTPTEDHLDEAAVRRWIAHKVPKNPNAEGKDVSKISPKGIVNSNAKLAVKSKTTAGINRKVNAAAEYLAEQQGSSVSDEHTYGMVRAPTPRFPHLDPVIAGRAAIACIHTGTSTFDPPSQFTTLQSAYLKHLGRHKHVYPDPPNNHPGAGTNAPYELLHKMQRETLGTAEDFSDCGQAIRWAHCAKWDYAKRDEGEPLWSNSPEHIEAIAWIRSEQG